MTHAYQLLGTDARQEHKDGALYDILYADDTLLLGSTACHVEELAAAISQVGSNYGLALHWQKTQALSVCTSAQLHQPDGSIIDDKGSLLYLGGTLTSSAGSHSELSRRLGLGGSGFHALRKLWNHGNVSQRAKLHYFQSLVMSVLTYGLSTLAFTRVQKRRMDGFHARCVRRILRIPAAFVSRVANRVVFERAQVKPLSQQLLDRQLLFFVRILRAGIGDPVRITR